MSDHEIVRYGCHLHAGDHVSWPFEISAATLQHHAIVVAHKGGNLLKVIHARSSSGKPDADSKPDTASSKPNAASCCSGSGSDKAYEVVEETVDFRKTLQDGELRRYVYKPSDCKEPVDVVQSAREKIGNFRYNALSNNCEHFARGCKTGNEKSCQADKAAEAAAWSTAAVASAAAISSLVGIAFSR